MHTSMLKTTKVNFPAVNLVPINKNSIVNKTSNNKVDKAIFSIKTAKNKYLAKS